MPTMNDVLARAASINNTTVANITLDAIKRLASRIGVYKDFQDDLSSQTIATVIAAAATKYNTTVADITPYCIQLVASDFGVEDSADPSVLTGRMDKYQEWFQQGGKDPWQTISLGTGTTLPTTPPAGCEVGDYYDLQVTINSVTYTKRCIVGGFQLVVGGDPTDPTDYVINWIYGGLK